MMASTTTAPQGQIDKLAAQASGMIEWERMALEELRRIARESRGHPDMVVFRWDGHMFHVHPVETPTLHLKP